MDFLRRSLAPISQEAWDEIDDQAKKVFKTLLT
ncbi:MAG: encapsulin, partial [Spirochaetia bacterium]